MRLREFAPAGGGGSGDYFQALASAWYNGTFDTGSLQKGIKSQQDVERLLNRGIVCPDGKTRKLHIDYNSDFDGVEIYSDDYYEYGDHDDTIDSRTGQKWGPYDFMAFSDEQLDEATGDKKFDSMLSRMTAEPKYPDQDMPPTSIAELIQWADRNNKPYHEYFAQWARRNGFKNVNDALVWFGDNVDPSNPWGPKDFLDPFGRPAAEELEDAAKHDPKAAELMKVFRCYEEIVFDWPDEYRQMNMPVSRKGTDESLNEFAADDGDSGEEDALHKYARMWWAGNEATQMQIEKVLARMGWEIGEDEGGYDNGGVFVIRAGDINGDSYTSWAAEDLTEGVWDNIKKSFTPDPNWQKRANQQAGHMAQGAVASGAHGHAVGHAMTDTGVAEGSGDPFGPQGRFVGDTGPAQITTTVARVQLKPGDKVLYKPTEQRARIEAMSRDGTQARIHIPSPMGGKTFNCKTSDLKALGALKEKSTSQAQFRTMAAAAHDPKFARKVGIKQSVAREFNRADKGQSYKSLPKKA